MKRSVSLKEFSNTPSVSTMTSKDGTQYVPPKPSTIRSNDAMQQQGAGNSAGNAAAQDKKTAEAETVPGFEME